MNKLTDPITFYQACFITGMSSDASDFFNKTLNEDQKKDFIQNERDTVTDAGYKLAVEHRLYPNY